MRRYLLKRTFELALLFLGITFLCFLVIRLAPAGPVEAQSALNPKMTEEAKAKLAQLYGMDRPIWEQYAHWLGRVVRVDFGTSFRDGEPVAKKISYALPVTLLVNGLSLFLILVIGIPVGILCAAKKDSWIDRLLSAALLAGFSMPVFWLGLLAMSFFGAELRWLPVSGLTSIFFDEMNFFQKAADLGRHLVLPVFLSALTGVAGISRFVRSRVLEELSKSYVCAAVAKGLSRRQVMAKHILKNALLPLITLLGLALPGLVGGSVIFESIFSIPGMDRLFYQSVFARDYPVLMGLLVVGSFLTLVGNFIADLFYRWADPRVRLYAAENL